MIRKAAVQVAIFALIAFIARNSYLGINYLKQLHELAAHSLQASTVQAQITRVLIDLSDMETGQRGYLLTADTAYLQPYLEAKARIADDFAALRAGLANLNDRERSLASELEILATSKEVEMEHTINLRQQGYRHRAFMLVASNEGMEYMNKARALLNSLSMAENARSAGFDADRNAVLSKASKQIFLTNSCLFALSACLFLLVRYHGSVLEKEAAQSREELASRDLQLKKLTSALSNQARFKTSVIEANAQLLLENYGGFLPRQGHEYAEQIKEASAQMERLRQDLLNGSSNGNHREVEYESVA